LLAVAEKFQGAGLGARLLHNAMGLARQAGMDSLLLEVRPSNARALGLYQHFGFQRIGIRRAYYPASSGAREDALVMRRTLEEVLA
jgi:ribosomal-protein-alanine N-acetyltransferase